MPVAFGEVAAVALTAAGGTTLTVGFPRGISATLSELVVIVGQKPATANGGTITDPSGWTQRLASLAGGGYGATLGSSTGNTNLWMYSKDAPAPGDGAAPLSITLGDTDVAWGLMIRLDKSEPGSVAWASSTASEADTGQFDVTYPAINLTSGDFLVNALNISTAVSTFVDLVTLTQTGSTIFNSVITRAPNAGGNQLTGGMSWHAVTAGSGTGTAPMTVDISGLSTNARGPAGLLRARLTPSDRQTAYRWGLDDGNEAAHTFAAAQDTPITVGAGQRRLLRAQVDEQAAADRTAGYTLQYKRSDEGDDQWRDL